MNVLLTGASSFSGLWFAEKLRASGATVVAPLRAALAAYDHLRGRRVRRLGEIAEIVPECPFGSERMLALVSERPFDVLCHHAARVGDYRNPDFDVTGAVAENTHNLQNVLEHLQARGLRAVVATGSVFEQDEGVGEQPLRAFSPYGLSKGLTWDVERYWCTVLSLPLAKFVIANTFGPYEEARFGAYLVRTWRQGETAEVQTPGYLRDNIHVDLLALTYARFVREVCDSGVGRRFGPCGYVETQGSFAQRFAAELRPRLNLECRLKLRDQVVFSEPRVRINTEMIDPVAYGWSEATAWDSLANYYSATFSETN